MTSNEGGKSIYKLAFKESALKEWTKLDPTLRGYFKKKLEQILTHPRIPANKLRGHPDRYKIKLRQAGYRLIYEVNDKTITVLVVAIGRRDTVYKK